MKICKTWLTEYIFFNIDMEILITKFSLFGFEIDHCNKKFVDINILPNRGDCLSLYFISKEIFSIFYVDCILMKNINININVLFKFCIKKIFNIDDSLLYYEHKIISGVQKNLITPKYIKNRLVNSGVTPSFFLIDLINYIFLELGQPLDIYDYDLLINDLYIEKVNNKYLFDGKIFYNDNILITRDAYNLLSISGIKNVEKYNITKSTNCFIVGAGCYNFKNIRYSSKCLNTITNSSYRFERNIVVGIQNYSIKRISFLFYVNRCEVGVSTIYEKISNLYNSKIILRFYYINRILGIRFSILDLELIFKKLYIVFFKIYDGWNLLIPKIRQDIFREIDIVEEIIRIYGIENLSHDSLNYNLNLKYVINNEIYFIKFSLINKGYYEVINYSFINDKLEKLLNPVVTNLILQNPISYDMNVMRTTLVGGLLTNLKYNLSRQKNNIKFFEMGKVFVFDDKIGCFCEKTLISGVCIGNIFYDQWGVKAKKIDFFDVKNDIEFLCYSVNKNYNISFISSLVSYLNINESVSIYINGIFLGFMGLIKFYILSYLCIDVAVYSFEINLDKLLCNNFKNFIKKPSKYPCVSRDLTFLLKDCILVGDILNVISNINSIILKDVLVLNLYKGIEIPKFYKSISFRFLMQSQDFTLIDDLVNLEINKIINILYEKYEAVLR
ncbi:MAG: phenylalanine--tRNA ligase subunit beta [Candidatus Azosocius agrarius]|nr:MAG: phenylalanine--tRNA ligase subunit beta [Gammaproteobacteria bacterium]